MFTVRVWPERLDGDRDEWRGEVLHVESGRRRFFRRWDVLVDFLRSTVEDDGVAPDL